MSEPIIVVGVDGSPGADHALAWAQAHAQATGAAIRVVMTWDLPVSMATAPGVGVSPSTTLERAAEAALGAVLDRAGDAGVTMTPVLRQGSPYHLLLAEAEQSDARLLVVGTRGLGPIRRVLLGSVSARIARDATMPVAIVAAGAPLRTTGPVVVGVDGSAGSHAALRWAAEAPGGPVHALHVVPPPIGPEYGLEGWLGGEQETYGRLVVGRAVEEALGADADVELDVRIGDARDVINEFATTRRASLVVIGSRGGWGLGGLGSVTTSVATHSDVTVVVVPPT